MKTEDDKKKLVSLIRDFANLGNKIDQLLQSSKSNELHDLFTEGYPKYLPSFDEFIFDIHTWKEKIESLI